jgi:hypothetical protein
MWYKWKWIYRCICHCNTSLYSGPTRIDGVIYQHVNNKEEEKCPRATDKQSCFWLNEWLRVTTLYLCLSMTRETIYNCVLFPFLSFSSPKYNRILNKRKRDTSSLFVLSLRSTFRMRCLATERLLPFFSLLDRYLLPLSLDWCRVFSLFFFPDSQREIKDLQMDKGQNWGLIDFLLP